MNAARTQGPLQTIKASIGVNEAKKLEPDSPMAPTPAPLWKEALGSINSSWKRILDHDGRHLMRGYPVVDPYILAKSDNSSKTSLMYFFAWLGIRASWLAKVSRRDNGKAALPDPQMWRTYLHMVATESGPVWDTQLSTPSKPAASSSRTTAPPTKRRKLDKSDIKTVFGLELPEGGQPVKIMWQDEVILDSRNIVKGKLVIRPLVQRQVIWDAFEHNFRLELLALDQCVVFREDLDERGGLLQDNLVADVFPEKSLIIARLPTQEGGLAARRWEDRRPYVEALRRVLIGWPGADAMSLRRLDAGPSCSQQQTEAIEVIVYHLYCQTFFNYFGRPPSTPHQLPL